MSAAFKINKVTILSLIAFGLFVAAYFPAFKILVTIWADSDDYKHAFLVLPIIGYLILVKRSALVDDKTSYSYLGLLLLLVAVPGYYFALLTAVNSFIFLMMFITIIGALIYLSGIQGLKEFFMPLFLAVILIPFPEQLYTQVTFPLQLMVSQASETLIRFFDVPLLREGNIMNIPTKRFEVVEACSGLRSVITLFTLSIIMGYFMLKNFSSRIILVLASAPIAIVINIVRLTAMILLFHYFRMDFSEGILHTVTGVVIFGLALVILLLLQKVLESWEAK